MEAYPHPFQDSSQTSHDKHFTAVIHTRLRAIKFSKWLFKFSLLKTIFTSSLCMRLSQLDNAEKSFLKSKQDFAEKKK